jgi:enolase-phosphatase E1
VTASLSTSGVRGVVLDVEGTTTPIAFVHDVLFSYARTHVKDYLANYAAEDDVRKDIELLRAEHAEDVRNGSQPPPLTDELDSITNYVNWLIDLDRKSTGLKSLQGKIWREGYAGGTLRSQVFPDVAPAFARWRAAGLTISIFSSGSVLAQQLLFAHTEAGDLTSFINHYFDTSIGKKAEADSYGRIAESVGLPPSELLFISDVVSELSAAREAGMKTVLSIRPGNQPQQDADQYQTIESFDEL